MTEPSPPRIPPRFVPVLTEVVHEQPSAERPMPLAAGPGADLVHAPSPTPRHAADLGALEDQLLHRVMQRVDLSLEQHLHDAVAEMVLQHTHSLVPRLREEIEFVVRQAVAEAVAAELADRPLTASANRL